MGQVDVIGIIFACYFIAGFAFWLLMITLGVLSVKGQGLLMATCTAVLFVCLWPCVMWAVADDKVESWRQRRWMKKNRMSGL